MDTVGNGNSLNQNDSYFDGNTLQLIGYRILSFVVCAVTLGIAYPWMLCLVQGWETGHTVIHGRRLKFDGHGHQLIGKYLLWVFLTVITFGIYGIWFGLGMKKWIVKHTFYADEEEPVCSYFSGGAGGYLGIHIVSFILTFFTLGIGKAWADKMVLKWEAGHTHIGGSPLEFNGTGGQLFVNYLLLVLLTPLTLGIYALFFTVIYLKWQIKHTDAVYQTPEIQEKAKAHEFTVMQDFVKYRIAANDQEVAVIKSGYTGKEDAETLERMAEENNPFASYHLAKLLKGDGKRYEGRALELLQKAADGKYHPALLDLAGQQPSEQSVATLTQAAQCGNAEASLLLADRYRTAGDLPQAAYWFKVALEWGVPDAKKRADEYDTIIKSIAIQLSNEHSAAEQGGSNTALLVLGAVLLGVLVWVVPRAGHNARLFRIGLDPALFYFAAAGLLVGIAGIVSGIAGIRKNGKGRIIAGIILSAICFVQIFYVMQFWASHRNYEMPAAAGGSGSGYYSGDVTSGSSVGSGAPAGPYDHTDGTSASAENTETPVSFVGYTEIRGLYCSATDEKGYAIEYIIGESAFFDRERHLLYINFGLRDYDNYNYAQLKCENGWCTQGIAPGYGVTEVSYPYEEPPSGIEVWSANGYLISSHPLHVTEGSSAEWADWFERKYGSAYYEGMPQKPLDEIGELQGTCYSAAFLNLTFEYTINESVYFDRGNQILYIQFGVAKYSDPVQLRFENGWCTSIMQGFGITEIFYPYEEPPSSIEVWGYDFFINRHPLNVTEVTAEMEDEPEQSTPADSETNISHGIVGTWKWYYRTTLSDGSPELEVETWTFNSDGSYDFMGWLCFPDDVPSNVYYDGQDWFIGTGGGMYGSYVVNGNQITIQGTSANTGDEVTSEYTFDLVGEDILYLNNKEYRRSN